MLPRIYVDFNTMTMDLEEPRRVQVAQVGRVDPAVLPLLKAGARVVIFDEELEVEATLECVQFPEVRAWMAIPDWTTRRDLEP